MTSVPIFNAEDVEVVNALLNEFDTLRSFDQAVEWDARATAMLGSMETLPAEFENGINKLKAELESAKQSRQSLPFYKRLFTSRNQENGLQRGINEIQQAKQRIEDLYDRLQECVDLTPNSAESKKEMIQEFKARKKELQTEKRAVAAEMASIRVDSRQRTADTARGKYGAYDRRRIRAEKEASLQPHEDNKAAIERQIVKIERTINWLERFK